MPSFADVVERVKPAVVSVRVKTRQVADRGDGRQPGLLRPRPAGRPSPAALLPRVPRRRGAVPRRPARPRARPRPSLRPAEPGLRLLRLRRRLRRDQQPRRRQGATRSRSSWRTAARFDAKVVGTDPKTDLAVLKITDEGVFPFVKFAPRTPRVGDWVVAVGNPFGLGGTVTAGIVSARGRDIGSGPYDDYIQIDAPVNRGNSGGPTFNLSGEVVGVNTAIFSPSGGNVGIAFAIPVGIGPEGRGGAEGEGLGPARLHRRADPAGDQGGRGGDRPQGGPGRARRRGREGQPGGEGRHQDGRHHPRRRRPADPRGPRPVAPHRHLRARQDRAGHGLRDGQERQVSLEVAKQSGA